MTLGENAGSRRAAHAPGAGSGARSGAGRTAPDDRSLADIVGDIAGDLGALVKEEIQLATTEAKAEAKKAGLGAGLLGGAGIAGQLALVFASLATVFLLGEWMHLAWAALIVTALWAVVAAVLVQRGRASLREVDPTLETTRTTLKEDAQWTRERRTS